jgi:spore germination cell wall hydrolase CwlJ-like protein
VRYIICAILFTFVCLQIASAAPRSHTDGANRDSDVVCLALTIYHEARGERVAGREAVAQVVLNRMQRTGQTACQIVYERRGNRPQFMWTQFSPNRRVPRDEKAWGDALALADRMFTDRPSDHTGGATHFYNRRVAAPAWAQQRASRTIDSHVFVRVY